MLNATNSIELINNKTDNVQSILAVVSIYFILGLIDVTTLIGNFIVVIAVFSTRSLHTVTNMLIVSLAVADMLVAIFVLPLSIYMVIYNDWKFGNLTCDLWIGTDVLLCTASILNLCCISIDRYFAIIHPLTYTSQRSPKLARTMISITWIASVLISCPPVFGWKDKDRDKNTCSLNRLLSYRIYSSMGSFFLPCLVMIFVYLRIFKTINDREKYLKSNTCNYHVSNLTRRARPKSKSLSFKTRRNVSKNASSVDSNNQEIIDQDITELKERSIPNNQFDDSINRENTISKTSTDLDNRINHLICCQKHRNSNFSNCSINDIYLINNKNGAIKGTNSNRTLTRTLPNNLVGFKLATNSSNLNLNNSSQSKRSLFKRNKQTKSEESCMYSSTININKSVQTKTQSLISKPINNSSQHSNNTEQTRLARENKATKTLAIVVGCFILSWLPFFIMYVLEAVLVQGTISKLLADSLTWLGYCNSAFNPFIYAFCSKQFRSAFYRVTFGVYKKEINNQHRLQITRYQRNHQTNLNNNSN